ncbi:heavy metal-binding domain-containing protein [Cupriavidus basilensis]
MVQYFFCSESCQKKFQGEPLKYIAPAVDALGGPHPGKYSLYTCPMHPEIRQDHPGNCPKCGMTLEPLIPGLDEEENPNSWISVIASVGRYR